MTIMVVKNNATNGMSKDDEREYFRRATMSTPTPGHQSQSITRTQTQNFNHNYDYNGSTPNYSIRNNRTPLSADSSSPGVLNGIPTYKSPTDAAKNTNNLESSQARKLDTNCMQCVSLFLFAVFLLLF